MCHKQPYKSRFIANSSLYIMTELSKLLTSCLTIIENAIKYYDTIFERSGPEIVKLFFSNSTQLSMKLVLLINLKLLTIANSFLPNIAEHEFYFC